jgi:hypothetical protein
MPGEKTTVPISTMLSTNWHLLLGKSSKIVIKKKTFKLSFENNGTEVYFSNLYLLT